MDNRATDRRKNSAADHYVLDVRDIIRAVMRHKILMAVLMAAPIFLGFIYLLTRPDEYVATASVVLEEQALNLEDVEDAFPGMEFDNMTVDTQAKVLSSSTVADAVIERLGLQLHGKRLVATESGSKAAQAEGDGGRRHAAMLHYARNLTVAPIKSSRAIDVSFRSEDPYLAADVANTHVEEYIDLQIRQKREQAAQLNKWLANQVAILKKQSAEKAAAVQAFRAENNIITGRDSEDLIYQQISDIAAELVPVESRKLDLQARHEAVQASPGATTAVQESLVVQNLKTQASAARQELQAMSAKYGKNHPLYIEAQRKVGQVEGDIAREKASIGDSVENELKTVTAQEEMLKARLEELKVQADEQREKQIELKTLEFEAEASAKLLDSFIARYEEITSQLDFARPDARIVSKAEIPIVPAGGRKPLVMMVIVFLSAVFAVAVVYVVSMFDRGVHSADELRKHVSLRLLGVLPDVKNPVAETMRGDRSVYLEEVKRIYLLLSGKPEAKIIQMTAASVGEGKTSMTLALAAYLVSAGHKTAVVDADLQTPDVARLAGVDELPGLSEVLAGKADIASVIRRDERGVHIVPAGKDRAGRLDMHGSAAFRAVLDNLRANYDYVLIDSAPVLESTDAGAVAGLSDQTVMVVASGHTRKVDLKKAADTLRQFAKEYPSAILNKADLKEAA